MVVCSSIKACATSVINLHGNFQTQMSSHICNIVSLTPSTSYRHILKQGHSSKRYSHSLVSCISSCFSDGSFQGFQRIQCMNGVLCKRGYLPSLIVKSSDRSKGVQGMLIDFSCGYQDRSLSTLMPTRGQSSYFKCKSGTFSWSNGGVGAGIVSGLLLCYSTSDSAHAEASDWKGGTEDSTDSSSSRFSHGKKVCTDYTIIGIPGDGRCLFRSVAHGACLRSGKPAPNESSQKQLADELRARVADEFIRRREETEWFIEGDFDNYVSQIRKPHVWGGEPELLMLSHVLRMPIAVYMHDQKHDGLISIAEYGQEYGKDNPIRVLYHGPGHYDALHIPAREAPKSRL